MNRVVGKLVFGVALLSCVFVGCGRKGSGPELAQVRGIVTLDGTPLSGASVMFQPETGRPSYGTTDSSGNYSLNYLEGTPGAVIGQHKVRIRTEIAGEDGAPVQEKERLPKRYHDETELIEDVKSGRSEINFTLTTK